MSSLVLDSMTTPLLALLGLPGGSELIIVLVIIVLLFGNRLPGTMRSLGQSLVQFKKGMKENDDDQDGGADKLK